MALNIARATSRNAHWGARLGWRTRASRICTQIFRSSVAAPESAAFAQACYAWQRGRSGLVNDGIIGPNSWRVISAALASGRAPANDATPSAPVAEATVDPTLGVSQKAGFVFLPNRNEKRFEYTGAFRPAADTFCSLHGIVNRYEFNPFTSASEYEWHERDDGTRYRSRETTETHQGRRDRRNGILRALRQAPGQLETIAYFGHGVANGLPSADFTTAHLTELSQAIAAKAAPNCKVILYACSSAREGGFNEQLANLTQRPVYGHTTTGHTCWNPHVRLYRGEGSPTGAWIIAPDDALWRKWRLALRNTNLWARFPFMTSEQIRAEVNAYEG